MNPLWFWVFVVIVVASTTWIFYAALEFPSANTTSSKSSKPILDIKKIFQTSEEPATEQRQDEEPAIEETPEEFNETGEIVEEPEEIIEEPGLPEQIFNIEVYEGITLETEVEA